MTETLKRTEATPGKAAARPQVAGGRLAFLDWTRGLAALIMLQGHVFHSFARTDLHESGPYVISQFVGGLPPAIFLFLTGVTLAFGMDGRERKGASRGERWNAALRRAGYLALVAFAFRIQLWAFGYPHSPVEDLLKVDILNCMAVAIAAISSLALLKTSQRVHAGVIAGMGIAVAAPLLSLIDPGALPGLVGKYLRPDPNHFSFFPWAAFVAFGVAAGSILRLANSESMHRLMQWTAIIGFGLIFTAQYFANLPYSIYPAVDFWLNSPALIFIKLGVIFVLLALAFLWTHHGAGNGWSFVRQLGTTSLLVYWVHIELVYGRWFGYWKESLTNGQCVIAAILLIISMVALSWMKTNWTRVREMWSAMMYTQPEPRRVSGD